MEIFTLTEDAGILGKKNEEYGFTYWVAVEETDIPVRFSSHNTNFTVGQKIVAEEKYKPKSGKDYWQLRKVKKVNSGSQELLPSTPATKVVGTPATDHEMLVEILDIVRKLSDSVPDIVADVDPEEEIDLDSIPDE